MRSSGIGVWSMAHGVVIRSAWKAVISTKYPDRGSGMIRHIHYQCVAMPNLTARTAIVRLRRRPDRSRAARCARAITAAYRACPSPMPWRPLLPQARQDAGGRRGAPTSRACGSPARCASARRRRPRGPGAGPAAGVLAVVAGRRGADVPGRGAAAHPRRGHARRADPRQDRRRRLAAHLGRSPSLFVNAATWGLLLTGKLVATHSESGLSSDAERA